MGSASAGSTVSQLVDAKWPITSSLDMASLHTDEALFLPTAAAGDRTRFVKSYDPAAGSLVPDTPWSAAPTNGQVYELGTVPPIVDGYSDLHALINEALKRCFVLVELSATPTINDRRHSLGTIAAWLTNELLVYQVGYLLAGEDRNQRDPYERVVSGQVIFDGATALLETAQTFNATDTLYIRVLKPAYYHCRPTAGTFGAQSGLSLETDEAEPPADWVAVATLVEYWLRQFEADPNSAKVAASLQRAQLRFTDKTRAYLHPPRRTFQPIRARFGPPVISGFPAAHRIIVV